MFVQKTVIFSRLCPHPVGTIDILDLMYVVYQLNNKDTNPYAEWLNQGSPKTPTLQDLLQTRSKEVSPLYLWMPLRFLKKL